MKEFIVKEGSRNRKKVETTCCICDSKFLVRKSWVDTQKTCSKACSYKLVSLRKCIEVECAYCNTKFSKHKSKLSSSKSGLYFCCREHKDLAQRIGGLKEIQPAHYGTANGKYGYRKIAFDSLPNSCRSCGYNKYIDVLVVHHKDRNRGNNFLTNLEILCPTCHMEEHYVTASGLWTEKK